MKNVNIVFSGLDSSVAGPIESRFADAGVAVFSNAKNHRMSDNVPILLPMVNEDHLSLIKQQDSFKKTGGFIVTNANCASTGLCIALKPILDKFGLKTVVSSTLQAISGAGYPGLSSVDILDNVIPFIDGEEEKLQTEPLKILGCLTNDAIQPLECQFSCMVHRVPVSDGHIISSSIKLTNPPSDKTKEIAEICQELCDSYQPNCTVLLLPSCPSKCVTVIKSPDRPQPRLDRMTGNGMTVTIGYIKPCSVSDIRLTCLSHNTIIGAAGGSILNAELAVSKNLVQKE
eukprot:GHVL01010094.1.p1 GENE.GHVL01010094.1~~GHVL01010094.1.p1  ORF type:complete len:287 (+),score=55.29 GHVL01010094.1:227-1087(+)